MALEGQFNSGPASCVAPEEAVSRSRGKTPATESLWRQRHEGRKVLSQVSASAVHLSPSARTLESGPALTYDFCFFRLLLRFFAFLAA